MDSNEVITVTLKVKPQHGKKVPSVLGFITAKVTELLVEKGRPNIGSLETALQTY